MDWIQPERLPFRREITRKRAPAQSPPAAINPGLILPGWGQSISRACPRNPFPANSPHMSSHAARGEIPPANYPPIERALAVTMQQERGLQAAEAWILHGASEFPDSFFDSLNGGWRYRFGSFGTVAAGGHFCGLKAALRSPSLHGYGLELVGADAVSTWKNPLTGGNHGYTPINTDQNRCCLFQSPGEPRRCEFPVPIRVNPCPPVVPLPFFDQPFNPHPCSLPGVRIASALVLEPFP